MYPFNVFKPLTGLKSLRRNIPLKSPKYSDSLADRLGVEKKSTMELI